jgi:hypothetical protein
MLTLWGELPVSDAHVHFFSHRFFTMLTRQMASPVSAEEACAAAGVEAPPSEAERLAQQWVEEFDRHEVKRSVLLASLPGDEASVAAAVMHAPDRFWGWFFVNPTADNAAANAAKWLDAGMRGICLLPAMHGYPLADDRVELVVREAEARPGTVVFIHCGVLSVGIRRKLGIASRFDMRFSNPMDVHALALRHPAVPFVIPHFGAGYFREALMLCDLCPNVHLDTSGTNSWVKYESGDLPLSRVFRKALDVTGPKRLLFGTDSSFFPRGWNRAVFEQQCSAMREAGMQEEAASLVLGGNLERLMKKS